MNECSSIKNNSFKTIDKTFLYKQTKFWLDEISKIVLLENSFTGIVKKLLNITRKKKENA